jgi:hypothetical protein
LEGVDILPGGRVGADDSLVVFAIGLPGDGWEHGVEELWVKG